ncbi:PAN/Apple domain [Trinorchestia longiramus]|nr:PAN/Apple domain [Trinorchestia longiramus]
MESLDLLVFNEARHTDAPCLLRCCSPVTSPDGKCGGVAMPTREYTATVEEEEEVEKDEEEVRKEEEEAVKKEEKEEAEEETEKQKEVVLCSADVTQQRCVSSRIEMWAAAALLWVLTTLPFVHAQQCLGGTISFEKTTGYDFSETSQTLLQQLDSSITSSCNQLCKDSSACQSFRVSYDDNVCVSFEVTSERRRNSLLPRRGNNFFEKVCLRGVNYNAVCGSERQWAFERVPDAFLEGFDNKTIPSVDSRKDCSELCLTEQDFTCRSAEYDTTQRLCRLSQDDRRTQPGAFMSRPGVAIDYLENQCARKLSVTEWPVTEWPVTEWPVTEWPVTEWPVTEWPVTEWPVTEWPVTEWPVTELPDCRYEIYNDAMVVSTDQLNFGDTRMACEDQCDAEITFNCRAFTLDPAMVTDEHLTGGNMTGGNMDSGRCYLSGDDSVSLNNTRYTTMPGLVTGEMICTVTQCEREGGSIIYEKSTAMVLSGAREMQYELEGAARGITVRCAEECLKDTAECPAFSIDYSSMRCSKLDRNTQGRVSDLRNQDNKNYFEKTCVRVSLPTTCKNKAWQFERVVGRELRGNNDRIIPRVQTRRDCIEACLLERTFTCRSAEYDAMTLDCVLSRRDRRSSPRDFIASLSPTMEYLENQCAPGTWYVCTRYVVCVHQVPGCASTRGACAPDEQLCPYVETRNAYPRYLDAVINNVRSEGACERQCSGFTSFICRSFAWYSVASQCFISGDDKTSAGINGAIENRPGTNYFERSCIGGGGGTPGGGTPGGGTPGGGTPGGGTPGGGFPGGGTPGGGTPGGGFPGGGTPGGGFPGGGTPGGGTPGGGFPGGGTPGGGTPGGGTPGGGFPGGGTPGGGTPGGGFPGGGTPGGGRPGGGTPGGGIPGGGYPGGGYPGGGYPGGGYPGGGYPGGVNFPSGSGGGHDGYGGGHGGYGGGHDGYGGGHGGYGGGHGGFGGGHGGFGGGTNFLGPTGGWNVVDGPKGMGGRSGGGLELWDRIE